ncbi:MAG: pyrimidine 5'-nucleotidase [Anaerolineae bacterium]|nr:pyrimidine 5'-nucleotidase [Anaerolineae bacterium]MDW8099831.1 pyrimidine 5'-nucleotidase [Anaerolineae bacterium]
MRSIPIQCVLFDLDDTLYPRHVGLMDRVHERMDEWIVRHLGISYWESAMLRQRFYEQYGTSMAGLLAEYHIDPDDFLHYVHDFSPSDLLQPDPALHQALCRIPLRRVVFTNGTRAHAYRVLDALGIETLFERVIDVVDVGYVSKPAPLAYQRALALLHLAPGQCIMVEDSPRNLAPARAMGMITVLVGDKPHQVADYHVPEITWVAEVVDYVLRISKA